MDNPKREPLSARQTEIAGMVAQGKSNRDIAKKKAQLSYASPGRQRMLSAFAYNLFAQTLAARAARYRA